MHIGRTTVKAKKGCSSDFLGVTGALSVFCSHTRVSRHNYNYNDDGNRASSRARGRRLESDANGAAGTGRQARTAVVRFVEVAAGNDAVDGQHGAADVGEGDVCAWLEVPTVWSLNVRLAGEVKPEAAKFTIHPIGRPSVRSSPAKYGRLSAIGF
jgi:hypothetical protein